QMIQATSAHRKSPAPAKMVRTSQSSFPTSVAVAESEYNTAGGVIHACSVRTPCASTGEQKGSRASQINQWPRLALNVTARVHSVARSVVRQVMENHSPTPARHEA